MKPLPIVLVVLVLSAAVSAATGFLLAPAPAQASLSTEAAGLAALTRRCERIEEQQVELVQALDGLRARVAERGAGDARSLDVEAAVARYFERNPLAVETPQALPADAVEEAGLSAEEAFAMLVGDDLQGVEREELWQTVRESGQMDALIAAFEERAEADPDDPDLQVELGTAYIEKIQEVGNGPLAGVWATKADQAFDRALALDETHWDARFSKAVSLSFWPPVFGKQREAINHFQVLVDQQGARADSAHFAQTHLLLGNMYQQIGDAERALRAWEHGLAIFPDHAGLREQLDHADQ